MIVHSLNNTKTGSNMDNWRERTELAASFRWIERMNMHEAVGNHLSLAVNADGTQFLMNPNQVHFSLIKASDLILIDANDPKTLHRPDAPDKAAWGLHGAIHRRCPHHRCLMHVHSVYATILACLEDSNLHGFLAATDHWWLGDLGVLLPLFLFKSISITECTKSVDSLLEDLLGLLISWLVLTTDNVAPSTVNSVFDLLWLVDASGVQLLQGLVLDVSLTA